LSDDFSGKLTKKLELRTTIVGKNIFTAAVDSQVLDKAQFDWRRQGLALIDAWQPYTLPANVEEKLLKLMNYFGLNYGAIDIILTPYDRLVFLEVNPCGEFFWLEKCPGLPISDAISRRGGTLSCRCTAGNSGRKCYAIADILLSQEGTV
jgi:glutathione synthase/RimK-type ligase-like ATP-grasp enzyme